MNGDKEKFDDVRKNELGQIEQETPQKNKFFTAVKIIFALTAISGLVYLSGIYQASFYRKTPAGIQQEQLPGLLDAETIIVPLSLFVFTGGLSGSERDEKNIQNLIQNASRIWEQAHIEFRIKKIVNVQVRDEDTLLFGTHPLEFIVATKGYDPLAINVFLARTLKGINGIAFPGINSIAVADFTSVFDFRTVAHEIGHILGLAHVPSDKNRLMYKGANGTALSLDEIFTAREAAIGF